MRTRAFSAFALALIVLLINIGISPVAKATEVPEASYILASLRDNSSGAFGPARWNDYVVLTFGIGANWAWSYPYEGSIIGDELVSRWSNGTTGAFEFNESNEPDFKNVTDCLTNGNNDYIWLNHVYDGAAGGSGTSEKWWGIGNPDLAGSEIDFIRLRVDTLLITWQYSEFSQSWITGVKVDATWEIWGRRPVSIDIVSSWFVLGGSGKWITGYIEPLDGHVASDINISSVQLAVVNAVFPVDLRDPVSMGNYDSDAMTDLRVSFDATAISDYLASLGWTKHWAPSEIKLTITGQFNDGKPFSDQDVIRLRMVGDVDLNRGVDVRDLARAARAFGTYLGHPNWDEQADENGDNRIDIQDLILIAKNFGKMYF